MAEAETSLTTPEILFIDDDYSVRFSVHMMLDDMCQNAGVRVEFVEVTNAEDALDRLDDEHRDTWPAGAIVDGLGGKCWPVIERARKCGIPVLLFTSREEFVWEAKNMGVPACKKGSITVLLQEVVATFPFMAAA